MPNAQYQQHPIRAIGHYRGASGNIFRRDMARTSCTCRHDNSREVIRSGALSTRGVATAAESEWVAQTIEGCGHEVVVADPNYALMYGVQVRAVKTDRRDVAALAEACRLGIYRAAHRVSAAQRQVRRQLRVRDQLIRMRTQAINLLRAQLRQAGYRLPSGASPNAATRCRRLALSPELGVDLAPVLTLLDALAPLIKARDQEAETQAAADPVVRQLMTAPGVGPIVGLTYRAVLDDVARFRDASSSTAFLGLVPRE